MDIFIEHIIGWVYVDSLPPASRVPKCKRKFDILFEKKIQSKAKQKKKKKKENKTKSYTSSYYRKCKILLFNETFHGSFLDNGLQQVNVKQEPFREI